MSDKIRYTYVNKRKQDVITYAYILAALIISLAAMARFFPQLVASDAGGMMTAIYIVASGIITLLLVLPFMKLKKKYNWFVAEGEATLGEKSITFNPGVTIAYKDIFRILCDNTADFGRPTQRLRVAFATTAFQLIVEQHRADDEETPFVQIARALGAKCAHLESTDYKSDIEYRMPKPKPTEGEEEIIYRKR